MLDYALEVGGSEICRAVNEGVVTGIHTLGVLLVAPAADGPPLSATAAPLEFFTFLLLTDVY